MQINPNLMPQAVTPPPATTAMAPAAVPAGQASEPAADAADGVWNNMIDRGAEKGNSVFGVLKRMRENQLAETAAQPVTPIAPAAPIAQPNAPTPVILGDIQPTTAASLADEQAQFGQAWSDQVSEYESKGGDN